MFMFRLSFFTESFENKGLRLLLINFWAGIKGKIRGIEIWIRILWWSVGIYEVDYEVLWYLSNIVCKFTQNDEETSKYCVIVIFIPQTTA